MIQTGLGCSCSSLETPARIRLCVKRGAHTRMRNRQSSVITVRKTRRNHTCTADLLSDLMHLSTYHRVMLWCAIAPSADRVCCVVIWQVCLLPVRAACWQTDWQGARAALAELSPVRGAETFPAGHMACRIRDGQSRNKTRAKQTCFWKQFWFKSSKRDSVKRLRLSIYLSACEKWMNQGLWEGEGRWKEDLSRNWRGGQWIKDVKSLIPSLVLYVLGLNIIFITVRWWNHFFQGPCFAVVFQLSFSTR